MLGYRTFLGICWAQYLFDIDVYDLVGFRGNPVPTTVIKMVTTGHAKQYILLKKRFSMNGKSYVTRLLEIVMLPLRHTDHGPHTPLISADAFSEYVSSSSLSPQSHSLT